MRGHHPRRQSSIPAECVALSVASGACVRVHVRRFRPSLSPDLRVLSSILVWYRAHGESERIPWPPRPRPTNTLSAWIRSSRFPPRSRRERGRAVPIRGRVLCSSSWRPIVARKFSSPKPRSPRSIVVQDGFPICAKTT